MDTNRLEYKQGQIRDLHMEGNSRHYVSMLARFPCQHACQPGSSSFLPTSAGYLRLQRCG